MNEWDGVRRSIGRYEVLDEIGSGGFSNVYHGRDPVLDREVAIKVMRPFLMSEPEFVIRFQREARIVANLDHANIVPIYDHGEAEGQLYIVMKLIPGGSLALHLAKGPLPWEQVVAITRDIASALDYAHKHGLVHRDIKPDNILLDASGAAQVTDFGVVKALENSTTTLSMSGGILGSPAYIAPEIWHGHPPTRAADIYALSCLVFEMVTGRKLYNAPTPPAAMALHFRSRQYPENWPENTPPGLEAILDHGLAQDPERRYAAAAELAEALAALQEDHLAEPYAALLEAIDAQKWSQAVELAESISSQDESYRDVSQLLAQTTRARAESQRMIWVNKWRDQANEAVAAGEWAMALSAARQWLQLSPDDSQAEDVIRRAREALEPVEEPVTAGGAAVPTADPLAEAYAALQEADGEENWSEAYSLAEKIAAEDPGYRDVQKYMTRAMAGHEAEERAVRIERLKSEAESAAAARDWSTALPAAQAWLALAPGDEAARRAVQQVEAALDKSTSPEETPSTKEKPAVVKAKAATRVKEVEQPTLAEYFASYKQRLRSGDSGVLPPIVLLVVAIIFSKISRGYFPVDGIMVHTAIICTIGLGVFYVFILGEIDLSVAALPALAALVLGYMTSNWNIPGLIAIVAALIVTTLVGLVQGWAIAWLKLPTHMVTLAGLALVSGITMSFLFNSGYVSNESNAIWSITHYRIPLAVGWIIALIVTVFFGYLRMSGRGFGAWVADSKTPRAIKIGQVILLGLSLVLLIALNKYFDEPGIPLIAPILLLLLFGFWFMDSNTRFAASVHAIGRESESAAQGGHNARRSRLLVFGLSGLMAGLGGIVWMSNFGGVDAGTSLDIVLLLLVYSALIIGGTSVFGGRGTVIGVLLGSISMAIFAIGGEYLGVGGVIPSVIYSLLFVLALALDALLRRRRAGLVR